MAGYLITSLLSLITNLLPSITASTQAPSSSSSNSNNSERGRARAVEEDLERLMVTLKGIKATLHDADEREIRDHYVKHWLKELRKVAYDAEDVLSKYRNEVTRVQLEARKASEASGSHKREKMEYIEYIVQIPDGMVDRLNKIRSRFDQIAKDREALQLKESDGLRRPNNKISRPPMGHMVDEANIFGRDAEIEKVINFLLSEKEKAFSVISIIGKGGLGKTTIAQLVYKDERVTRCFDLFGWVCVSEEFDVGRLTKAIIETVTRSNYDLSELSSLQEKLAETVKGETVLLVLDDVWNENQNLWELLMVPFKEAKLVRILVTTRNTKVANVMQTMANFWPDNLPEDLCWQLFQHYAFSGTSETVPPHLVKMGREIMRKCGGLPLAVKSIASLLRHETDEGWKEILESDLWEIQESKEVIFTALEISYAHLPAHLKPCFLFCSMYPKDYLLKKEILIELWMSHGYIESRGKKGIREIGVEYYKELKERSFLDDFSDRSSECGKLHDIIHDLARLKSENEHYSVDISQPLGIQERKILGVAYHVYARSVMEDVNRILQQNQGLRTLSAKAIWNLPKFEALRVLQWKEDHLKRIPDSISELKHLAYLSITASKLEMLPSSIGGLLNLQFLNIQSRDFLDYVPHELVNFPAIKSMRARLRVKTIAWLKDMTDLEGNLSISGVSNLKDAQHANMRNKCKLESLELSRDPFFHTFDYTEKSWLKLILEQKSCKDEWVGVDDEDFSWLDSLQPHSNIKKLQVFEYSSATLPGWMSDPTSLQSIQEISLDFFRNIQSLPLHNLHTLKYLRIIGCDSIRVLQLEQLPSQLEELHILLCRNLDFITGLGNLDKLATLEILSCPVLKSITMDELQLVEPTEPINDSSKEKPLIGQQSISSLTKLKISSCSSLPVMPNGLIPSGPCYETSIFGRNVEIEEVIDFLLSENKKPFSVISIIGKGGLGKTTIAQLVYKDERVTRCFHLFGWVCVSDKFEFNVGRLTKAIIETVTKINYGLSELSSLQEKLAEIVKGKTILLVLDDVWNENQSLWELLRVSFTEAKLVKILVTTRNKKVADVMQTTTYFRPTNLPEDSCWQLFQHYAFRGTSDTMPPNLVKMGREIMRKCGGLPLAVKSIASLLGHETDEEGWKEILESDLWEIQESKEAMFPALEISYAHLPAHLKPCFLFCSIYPRDRLLEKETLIKSWMCTGLIESRGKKGIREIGVEYYEELKGRSFLDDLSFLDDFSDRSSECCKLHDIIHDLAKLKSENKLYPIKRKGYACSVKGYVDQILPQNQGLRTLYMDLGWYKKLSFWNLPMFEALRVNLPMFEALRVLQLRGVYLTGVPDFISELKHLAFLSIISSDIEMLPSSIGGLLNLQFLYIESRNFLDYVPHGLVNFSAMKTMRARLRVKTISWLKDMTDLEGNLCIYGVSNLKDAQRASMRNKCKLETLELCRNHHWYDGTKKLILEPKACEDEWVGEKSWLKLIIEPKACEDEWVGEKSWLELTLEPKSCEDKWIGVSDADFSWLDSLQPHSNIKKLKVFEYSSATLPGWMSDPSSLQSIQEISLDFFRNIQSLPFSNLHTLKHLVISGCNSIRVLKLEQLPSQLEELRILQCMNLDFIIGLGNLNKLATLDIDACPVLKSITMDGLQLVERIEPNGDSSKEKPLISRQSISSLTKLKISCCDLLSGLPNGLIPSGPCYVSVSGCSCPDIEIGVAYF